MSDEDDINANAAEFLFDRLDQEGVGCVSVEDGTVFIFSEGHLRALLERAVNSERKACLVFVKRTTKEEMS